MDPSTKKSDIFILLEEQLLNARENDRLIRADNTKGKKITVPNTGKAISSAYEQLRNAAEYAEDHLILQRAIRRFLKRSLFIGKVELIDLGEDLIIELVQAGYLKETELGSKVAGSISQLAASYEDVYHRLRQSHVTKVQAQDWVLSILSVEIESILNPQNHHYALLYVAQYHFMDMLPRRKLVANQTEDDQYEISLYTAVHLALFKSDIAVVRHDIMRVYQQSPDDLKGFIAMNRHIDELYLAKLTNRLRRNVGKNGAPFRILKSMCDDFPNTVDMLSDRQQFLQAYRRQIDIEFENVHKRVNKGIVKSIFFILITKVIIGVGIEVPYDLVTTGAVAGVPLLVNLATPPLYMASLKFSLKSPQSLSKQTLIEYINTMIYTDDKPPLLMVRPVSSSRYMINWVYSILFFVPFALLVYILKLLDFNIPQMIIFFTFLSTASFLGFRLSSKIREVEFGDRQSSGFMTSLRDFFYLPFIVFGQWISGKYSKINLVSNVLDIVIELPLKTILKLARQWVTFLDQKQEEIY